MSLYDSLILQGEDKAKQEMIIALIQKAPFLTDQDIAEIAKKSVEFVKNIRKQLNENQKDKSQS